MLAERYIDKRYTKRPMARSSNSPESQDWGFTPAAESLNGRLAMLGFAFAVIIEALSGQGVLHFLNLI